MSKQGISCGLDFPVVPDLQACISKTLQNNYSFVVFPIAHPRFRRNYVLGKPSVGGFTRCDMILSAPDWTTRIVGKMSSYLNVDVPSPVARQRYEDCMNEELSYCRGLGLSAIMLNLHGKDSNNLSRLIRSYFDNSHHPSLIWVQLPLVCEKTIREFKIKNDDSEEHDEPWQETWKWWSQFHARLEFDKRVGAVLELTPDLPPSHLLHHWLGEPVKAIILPTSIFQTNKKGYPVLSRAHKDFVLQMISRDAQVIITGAHHCNVDYYFIYLHKVWNLRPKENDPMLDFALGWEDYIQTPLQPLADNLDTHTYNVFEKDPIKYNQYQKALVQALLDLKEEEPSYNCTETKEERVNYQPNEDNSNKTDETESHEKSNYKNLESDQGDNKKIKKTFTIMVLGAGRGPLIKAALNASEITGTQIIAVEKNPVAVVVLTALIRELWQGRNVQVVSGDMRYIQQDTQADIIKQNQYPTLCSNSATVTSECRTARRAARADYTAAPAHRTGVESDTSRARSISFVLTHAQDWTFLPSSNARAVFILLSSKCATKRKITDENRSFQEKWEEEFCFISGYKEGSWGDNELSPECLDGAAGLLRPGGISIPCAYTSYVTPVSSARLWAAAKGIAGATGIQNSDKNLETIWVVFMQNKYDIADVQPVFTFNHPSEGIKDSEGEIVRDNKGLPMTDNRRSATLTWEAKQNSVLHGFGGYFDCTLYGEHTLSIVPSTHTKGMISWFPVFIPIKVPP
ncbi:Protein arginine N-methyltransferase 5 [Eumeta japonica]|uniref:Protein arginine N-methyltransferase n=1 Tax=Eumeta variegata TaxID=151549 RepID=A0A4C1WVE5_EUMVA|nr:Protein arginine N-methyltransferase 5 [Eumeta japonica]